MHEYPLILFLALLTFAYGLISRLPERWPITGPMVFVAVGVVCSPLGFNLLDFDLNDKVVRVLAELTLVTILFVEASTIDLKRLIRERGVPMRLLLIGLPLTMAFGVFVGWPLFEGMGLWMLALMAFTLSPTDAALGQAVVTSEDVPENLRRAINVESGINDGMVLPPILLCIAAIGLGAADQRPAAYWVDFTVSQLVIGPLAGAAVGLVCGRLVDFCSQKKLMNATFQRLSSIAMAIMAWALAEEFHGNGYIAAFFAGLLLHTGNHAVRERIHEFGEAEGQQLTLVVFLIFGLAMIPAAIPHWTWQAWVYALLSLTAIRMIPVLISLVGSGMPTEDRLFIGWFGPRGIASVLYLQMIILDIGLEGHEYMLAVVVLTVMLSVYLHGLTAVPWSRRYRNRSG